MAQLHLEHFIEKMMTGDFVLRLCHFANMIMVFLCRCILHFRAKWQSWRRKRAYCGKRYSPGNLPFECTQCHESPEFICIAHRLGTISQFILKEYFLVRCSCQCFWIIQIDTHQWFAYFLTQAISERKHFIRAGRPAVGLMDNKPPPLDSWV